MKKEFKAKKLSGSIKVVEGDNGRTQMIVDYGGNELRKILTREPVKIDDCDAKRAREGEIEQQICMAYAYLSNQECKKAEEWSLKAFGSRTLSAPFALSTPPRTSEGSPSSSLGSPSAFGFAIRGYEAAL